MLRAGVSEKRRMSRRLAPSMAHQSAARTTWRNETLVASPQNAARGIHRRFLVMKRRILGENQQLAIKRRVIAARRYVA